MAKQLEVITANMMGLFLLAKCCHLNVTGPRFYSDHKTYDNLAATALEWYDTLAERMRALEIPVVSTAEWVDDANLLEEVNYDDDADSMAEGVLGSLTNLSEYINKNQGKVDNTTSNILQELDAELGKHAYFIRSSL